MTHPPLRLVVERFERVGRATFERDRELDFGRARDRERVKFERAERERFVERTARPDVRPRFTRIPRVPLLPLASDSLANMATTMNAMHATLRMTKPPLVILGRVDEKGGTRMRAPPLAVSMKKDSYLVFGMSSVLMMSLVADIARESPLRIIELVCSSARTTMRQSEVAGPAIVAVRMSAR